jgi:hypothetical protein
MSGNCPHAVSADITIAEENTPTGLFATNGGKRIVAQRRQFGSGTKHMRPVTDQLHPTKARIKATVTAALVSILVVAPWTIRNRLVLKRWIPIKSNGMYELWQSQCLDQDGVLDSITLGQHPWGNDGEQRQQYARLGEIAFTTDTPFPSWA